MLVEIAIGDAYGAGFEYVSDQIIRDWNDLSAYVQHPRHRIRPGCYTDDTQMSVAIAEAIVSAEPWTHPMLAERFVAAWRRDPREGYSSRTRALLEGARSSEEFLARVQSGSDKSGAAMRACPIGVFGSVDAVIERARFQAKLTHDSPGATDAAAAAALMTHYFLYRLGPKRDVGRFLASAIPGPWEVDWTGKVGSKGMMSVHAAVTAVRASDLMTDLLRTCVAFTGDVDTVAAVALGAGSCSAEIEQDLPPHLFDGLERLENGEPGPFGLDFLTELDRTLLARIESPQCDESP